MQVSQASDFITHASIGRGKVESFEIAQSAEFFQVLSSTLYSDKQLALVREVMCNAWDAHIAAGCTDLDIQVTVTEERITIRDFGHGIAPERIVEIYGTYGASTKTHDGTQTGGFGLGSKAPFAYSDHFEVTSFHKGTKTIYSMSLSCPENDGKPAAKTIMALPTDETGLQVSVGIKSQSDAQNFISLVRRIAFFGEMNAELNGAKLPTAPFSKAKEGFLAIPHMHNMGAAGIHLRYGSVIYPIPRHADYMDDLNWAKRTIDACYSDAYGTSLIFQAAPHSVSITPSRESLSMTDRTVATIKTILADFRAKMTQASTGKAEEIITQSIKSLWMRGDFGQLFRDLEWPGSKDLTTKKAANTVAKLAPGYARSQYSTMHDFDFKLRLESLIESGFDTTGFARKLLKMTGGSRRGETDWFESVVVKPLLKGLVKTPGMDPDRILMTYSTYGGEFVPSKLAQVMVKENYKNRHYQYALPLLRNIVILSHNRVDTYRAYNFPVMKHRFGLKSRLENTLLYVVPRKGGAADIAREFFTKRGFTIIDLTVRQPWETPAPVVGKEPKLKIPENLPASVLLDNHDVIRFDLLSDTEHLSKAKNVTNPEFYLWGVEKSRVGIAPLGDTAGPRVLKLYGDCGVITRSAAQRDKLIKAGVPNLHDWIIAQLLHILKTDKVLRTYLGTIPENAYLFETVAIQHNTNAQWHALRAVFKDQELRKAFKVDVSLTKEQQQIRSLIDTYTSLDFDNAELKKELKTITPTTEVIKLLDKIKESPLTEYLNWTSIREALKLSVSEQRKSRARDTVLRALKG